MVATIPESSSSQLCLAQRSRRRQEVAAHQIRQRLVLGPLDDASSLEIPLLDLGIVNQVQPVPQAVTTLGDLKLDGGDDRLVVRRVQITHGRQGRSTVRHHDTADVRVGVGGPGCCSVYGRAHAVALDPACRLGLVGARVDLRGEVGGPGLGICQGGAPDERLRQVRVPVGVEVVRVALVLDGDAVCPLLVRLVVQGLRDVPGEVDQELEGLCNVRGGEAGVADPLGVVGDGGDGAARRAAISVVVHVTRAGRVILCVDEMQRR